MGNEIIKIKEPFGYLKLNEKRVYFVENKVPEFKFDGIWQFKKDKIDAKKGNQNCLNDIEDIQ